jgi:hypothetical protein
MRLSRFVAFQMFEALIMKFRDPPGHGYFRHLRRWPPGLLSFQYHGARKLHRGIADVRRGPRGSGSPAPRIVAGSGPPAPGIVAGSRPSLPVCVQRGPTDRCHSSCFEALTPAYHPAAIIRSEAFLRGWSWGRSRLSQVFHRLVLDRHPQERQRPIKRGVSSRAKVGKNGMHQEIGIDPFSHPLGAVRERVFLCAYASGAASR